MKCSNCQVDIASLPCEACGYRGSRYDKIGDEDVGSPLPDALTYEQLKQENYDEL